MLDSFLTFINQRDWQLFKKRTLLTVSGGVDSAVLAHIFYKSGFLAGIAHCNFGLRGDESDEDEMFVRQMSATYGFDFFREKFDTKTFGSENGVSTQMAARTLRYEWFEEIRRTNNYDWIATAHHATDSFETILLNLVRGTGLAGLTGIAGERDNLLRPLINFSRQEIYDYAIANKLKWREDSSNQSEDYDRNVLRIKILPVLRQLNPSLELTFRHTAERLSAASRIVEEQLSEWKKKHVKLENGQVICSKQSLIRTSEPRLFLWEIIREFGFNYVQNSNIVNALSGVSGKMFHSATHTVLIDREKIVLAKRNQVSRVEVMIDSFDTQVDLGDGFFFFDVKTKVGNESEQIADPGKMTALFDLDKLRFPLKVRRWQTGDHFAPIGMGGKFKKVSDLFIDLKINRFEKESVWILENGDGDILWVTGYRMDDRYKLSGYTRRILSATFEKHF